MLVHATIPRLWWNKLPFVIATDSDRVKVFFVNVNTHKRVPLINLKKVNMFDAICDIQQTSNLEDLTKAIHYNNLKEIILHFKLNQHNKDGGDAQLIYCQLRISSDAIKLLVKTQGAIPISYMQALNDNLRQANEI